MLFITYGKRKPGDKSPKRQMTPEKSFRLREFRNWQSNRVVKEFDETKTGSILKATIDRQLQEWRKLKQEKPIAWEARADVVRNTIAVTRIEYIEELIKFLRKQKGVYKSTIELFENELKKFKQGMAWLIE